MNIIQPIFAVFFRNHRKIYSTRKYNQLIYEEFPQYKPFTVFLEKQIKKQKFSLLRDLYINEYWETSKRMDAILIHPNTSKEIKIQLHTQLSAMSNIYEECVSARKHRQHKMYHKLWSEMFQKIASFRAYIKRVEFQLNAQQGGQLCK